RLADVVKSGQYGKLLVSRALCYKSRKTIGVKPNGEAPANIDYNLWLGPALEHAFNANYVHYNWHWFWDFGNGDIGNQGVHQMDVGDTQLIFEVRGLETDDYLGQKIGNILHFEQGTIAGNKFYAKGKEKDAGEPLPKAKAEARGEGNSGHFGNFIAAVRSHKT